MAIPHQCGNCAILSLLRPHYGSLWVEKDRAELLHVKKEGVNREERGVGWGGGGVSVTLPGVSVNTIAFNHK